MALEDKGKEVMLDAFGGVAVRCRLYDKDGNDDPDELSGSGYAEQTVSWTYDGTGVILDADEISTDLVAEFDVPACSVEFVGFLNTSGQVLAMHELAGAAETFTNPGVYQVTAASLELDPGP